MESLLVGNINAEPAVFANTATRTTRWWYNNNENLFFGMARNGGGGGEAEQPKEHFMRSIVVVRALLSVRDLVCYWDVFLLDSSKCVVVLLGANVSHVSAQEKKKGATGFSILLSL
jgi:hypothetical protein